MGIFKFAPTETMHTAFRGGPAGPSGFVQNHYPIWEFGLPASYGVDSEGRNLEPKTIVNLWATAKGRDIRTQLKHPSKAPQSHALRFIAYFKTIINQEREKEKEKIKRYLGKLESNTSNLQLETLQQARQAVEEDNLSTAYTWIMKFQSDIKELKRQVQNPKKEGAFQNISHMNDFWDNEFSKYIEKIFTAKDRDYNNNYIVDDANQTVSGIIENYIQSVMKEGSPELLHNIRQVQTKMEVNFINLLRKANIGISDNIFNKKDFNKLVKAAVEDRKNRKLPFKETKTTKQKISVIAEYIGYEIGRGLGQELTIAARSSNFDETIHSGNMVKKLFGGKKVVQVKPDVYAIEAENTVVSLEPLVKRLSRTAAKGDWEEFEKVRREIDKIAQEAETDIFEVMYNVKGYQSRKDMFIAQGGPFDTRTAQLQALADTGAIPGDMFNKLIFLLYNTAKGCILDGNLDALRLYLGVACAVWFFDDYLDINVYSDSKQHGLKTVHIFTSGGNYYTLSEILQKSVDLLEEYALEATKGDMLFTIGVARPAIGAAEYQEVVNSNRAAMKIALENKDENQIQDLLKQRWDTMRNLVGQSGKLQIKARQNKLEELLSLFEAYLKS